MGKIYITSDNSISPDYITRVASLTGGTVVDDPPAGSLYLRLGVDGISLNCDTLSYMGDYSGEIKRLRHNNLSHELLIKAAKLKNREPGEKITIMDATAGMGEDSLLLAAAGYEIYLYEYNPVIFLMLEDTLRRASEVPELKEIVSRMHVFHENSIDVMKSKVNIPNIVLLDPMFPQRQKSGLIKKKFQLIQKLETPCEDGEDMLKAAIDMNPDKVIVKRPANGENLGNIKPDYTITGNSIRYDCYTIFK